MRMLLALLLLEVLGGGRSVAQSPIIPRAAAEALFETPDDRARKLTEEAEALDFSLACRCAEQARESGRKTAVREASREASVNLAGSVIAAGDAEHGRHRGRPETVTCATARHLWNQADDAVVGYRRRLRGLYTTNWPLDSDPERHYRAVLGDLASASTAISRVPGCGKE